jgi:hypothetical protein
MDQIRGKLSPLWLVLYALVARDSTGDGNTPLLSSILEKLNSRRMSGQGDGDVVVHALRNHLPEVEVLSAIEDVKPEDRLERFDFLVSALSREDNGTVRSELICFAAAYLVTIAAGGSPSIGLAERIADKWPQMLAWAYLIGSLGEKIVWNSSFDGLGRLVNRELSQSFSVHEYPSYDVLADEADVLVDRKLSDPLVRLRLKQQRIASVGLFPGVSISVALDDAGPTARNEVSSPRIEGRRAPARDLSDMADQIWPLIRAKFLAEFGDPGLEFVKSRNRGKKKESSQEPLPFKK